MLGYFHAYGQRCQLMRAELRFRMKTISLLPDDSC